MKLLEEVQRLSTVLTWTFVVLFGVALTLSRGFSTHTAADLDWTAAATLALAYATVWVVLDARGARRRGQLEASIPHIAVKVGRHETNGNRVIFPFTVKNVGTAVAFEVRLRFRAMHDRRKPKASPTEDSVEIPVLGVGESQLLKPLLGRLHPPEALDKFVTDWIEVVVDAKGPMGVRAGVAHEWAANDSDEPLGEAGYGERWAFLMFRAQTADGTILQELQAEGGYTGIPTP